MAYSFRNHDFISASDLKIKEQILAKNGTVAVTSHQISNRTQSVYNLEVRNKHNFLVGDCGVAVHNSYWPDAKELAKILNTTVKDYHDNIKPVIKKQFKTEMDKIGSTNPDIGYDVDGNLLLKNPSNGKEINTNFPISAFTVE